MKKIKDYETTQAAKDFSRLPAGGYVCIIKKVDDNDRGEYLYLEVDIAEGEWKNYAIDTQERAGFWPLKFYRNYGGKSLKFFKAFIEAVEETNNRFRWDWDEQKLVNKGVGIVFQEQEYENREGKVRTKLVPYTFTTAAKIREGDFQVPAPRLLDHVTATPTFEEEEDEGELPF